MYDILRSIRLKLITYRDYLSLQRNIYTISQGSLINAIMALDPFALAAIIILILLLPFMLFILTYTLRQSEQEEWDRAEQDGFQPLPKRPYTQRYINALDGEHGPRWPQLQISGSQANEAIRPCTSQEVLAVDESDVTRAADDNAQQGRLRASMNDAQMPLPKVYDLFDWSGSRVKAHKGGTKARRGAKIGVVWFDRV